MRYKDRPPRFPTHIPVVVSQGGVPQSGVIVDINTYGACLSGLEDVAPDMTVLLRGTIDANLAVVRWCDEDRAGVYFERPIPPQQLALLRLRGGAYTTTNADAEVRV